MKRILIALIITMVSLQLLRAQSYSEWSSSELARANTASGTSLSKAEQDVFLYCNLARLDGAKFMRTYAAKYLTGGSSYVSSLKRDLQQVKNRPMLYPEQNLCYTAAIHAQDMGSHGMTGHDSSDGTECFDRIGSYYKCGTAAENCSYGYSGALDIVMQLLIDDGVSSLGHRKSILNAEYNAMGTSIRPHKGYGYNCVQDFGAKLITPMPGSSSNNGGNNGYNNDYDDDDDYYDDDDDDDYYDDDDDDDYYDDDDDDDYYYDDDDDYYDNRGSNCNNNNNSNYNNNINNNSGGGYKNIRNNNRYDNNGSSGTDRGSNGNSSNGSSKRQNSSQSSISY